MSTKETPSRTDLAENLVFIYCLFLLMHIATSVIHFLEKRQITSALIDIAFTLAWGFFAYTKWKTYKAVKAEDKNSALYI